MNFLQNAILILVLAVPGHSPILVRAEHEEDFFDPSNLRRRLSDTFCWKDTFGRGVGTIPTSCGSDEENIAGLCYKKCPSGYYRNGIDCYQSCKDGLTDDGLFCIRNDYGRGAGYISNGDCEHHHGHDNCEKWGLIWYPKCHEGYHNDDCCICVPNSFSCDDLGFNGQVGNSCAKHVIDQIGTIPHGCGDGKQLQAGLCYHDCKDGYHGIGPVCWSNTPKGWVGCGAGDAETSLDCTDTITGQITSVFNSAVKITTLIIPGVEEADVAEDAATDAGSIAEDASQEADDGTGLLKKFKKLLAAFKLLLKNEPKIKAVVDAGKDPNVTPQKLLDAAGLNNTADIIRFSASLANFFDPTGVSGVVAAFSYPLCSEIST